MKNSHQHDYKQSLGVACKGLKQTLMARGEVRVDLAAYAKVQVMTQQGYSKYRCEA